MLYFINTLDFLSILRVRFRHPCAAGAIRRGMQLMPAPEPAQDQNIQNGTVMVQQKPLRTAETIENKGDIGNYEIRYRHQRANF